MLNRTNCFFGSGPVEAIFSYTQEHQGFPHPQSSDFLPTAPIFFGMLDFFSRFDQDLVIAQISIRGTRSKAISWFGKGHTLS